MLFAAPSPRTLLKTNRARFEVEHDFVAIGEGANRNTRGRVRSPEKCPLTAQIVSDPAGRMAEIAG